MCNQALSNKNPYENTEVILHQVEDVYREAVTTLQPQSLVFTGRSGSGKTCNFKKALEYLVDTTQDEAEPVFTSTILFNPFIILYYILNQPRRWEPLTVFWRVSAARGRVWTRTPRGWPSWSSSTMIRMDDWWEENSRWRCLTPPGFSGQEEDPGNQHTPSSIKCKQLWGSQAYFYLRGNWILMHSSLLFRQLPMLVIVIIY